jgi:hypothetical protein
MLTGVLVWMLIAGVIVALIFRLFFFYLGMLKAAGAPL